MGNALEAYRVRARAEGHWRTWVYFFGTLLLPMMGIQIKHIMERVEPIEPGDPLATGVGQVVLATSMQDLSAQDVEALRAFEGQPLVDRFERDFSGGHICTIARGESGALASVSWFEVAQPHLCEDGFRTYLGRDAFTVPQARGKGLLPLTLVRGIQEFCRPDADPPGRVVLGIAFTNRASLRAVAKVGLHRTGIIFQVRTRGLVVMKRSSSRRWRWYRA